MPEVNATIDRFEGDMAVVAVGDERFNLPRKLLPAGCGEGDGVALSLRRNGEQTEDKKRLAKEMLNEILHSTEE